jgi:hypothetical protein
MIVKEIQNAMSGEESSPEKSDLEFNGTSGLSCRVNDSMTRYGGISNKFVGI